jgi:hypothetical protein
LGLKRCLIGLEKVRLGGCQVGIGKVMRLSVLPSDPIKIGFLEHTRRLHEPEHISSEASTAKGKDW